MRDRRCRPRLDAAVNTLLQCVLDRREDRGENEQRHHDRQIRTLSTDRDEGPLEQRDDRGINAGEDGGQEDVDHGAIDDQIDVVEAVAKDRDPDCHGQRRHRQGREELGRPNERRREARRRLDEEREENERAGEREPLELLALVGVRTTQAIEERGGADHDEDEEKGLEDRGDRVEHGGVPVKPDRIPDRRVACLRIRRRCEHREDHREDNVDPGEIRGGLPAGRREVPVGE